MAGMIGCVVTEVWGGVYVPAGAGAVCPETGAVRDVRPAPDYWRKPPGLEMDAELALIDGIAEEFALRRDGRGMRVIADLAAFRASITGMAVAAA